MGFRNNQLTLGSTCGRASFLNVILLVSYALFAAAPATAREPFLGAAAAPAHWWQGIGQNHAPVRAATAASAAAAAAATVTPAVAAAEAAAPPDVDWDNKGHFKASKLAFLRRYGRQYGYNGWIDKHWQREVGQRFGPNLRHYLDFTGAGLYTTSHIRAANQLLEHQTFSNPHSRNPTSLAAEQQLLAARKQVLAFFKADEEEYTVVWTSGATAALKRVGESFPWTSHPGWQPSRHPTPGGFSDSEVGSVTPCTQGIDPDAHSLNPDASHFVYFRSNHKSVLGIGGFARARGAVLSCLDEEGMVNWLYDDNNSNNSSNNKHPRKHDTHRKHENYRKHSAGHTADVSPAGPAAAATAALEAGAAAAATDVRVAQHPPEVKAGVTFSLVAYPSKDNYEGRLYPLDWVEQIHAKSSPHHRWMVVLDAAAYVPTHPLDLSKVHPDFVPVSWYKVFGFPTGLGALVARKESLSVLHKVFFGGGSVVDATAEDIWRVLMPPPDGFEDGTQSFLSIAQLQFGFAQLQQLGGIQAIEDHVRSLQSWLYQSLTSLKHINGRPMVKLFGHHHQQDPMQQSCIFQLLVLRADGSVVSSASVEKLAAAQGLGIREGCMCNPSQCIVDLGIRPEEHRAAILNKTDTSSGFLTVWRPAPDGSRGLVPVQLPVGSIRASLGYLSTFEDVYALVQFLRNNYQHDSSAAEL